MSTIIPVRICDIGGWTDTWFSKNGHILNLSVYSRYFGSSGPYRGIDVSVSYSKAKNNNGRVRIFAADPNFDQQTLVKNLLTGNFDKTNLLLGTLSLIDEKFLLDRNLDIRILSPIPPGASMGTSAAVAVGLVKAICDGKLNNAEIAKTAWRAETEVMGGQSGTQDQYSTAFSFGVNNIEITEFPNTTCKKVPISKTTQNELEQGLITVFYGQHDSSTTHRHVITELEEEGPGAPRLQRFRPLTTIAKKSLMSGNLIGFGKVMQKNTECQRLLYAGIISKTADTIIDLAKNNNALGWKVNGAGGAGGSITLLFDIRKKTEEFHDKCQKIFKEENYFYFEHQLSSNHSTLR